MTLVEQWLTLLSDSDSRSLGKDPLTAAFVQVIASYLSE